VAWGESDDSALFAGRPDGAAYVCRGFVCHAPATTIEELSAQLKGLPQ
jgi:uncharacterized protein YyaL (SSP411 family)